MKVSYPGESEDYEFDVEAPFCLLASDGSYALLGACQSVSAFDGVYFFDNEQMRMVKCLHDISINSSVESVTVLPDEFTLSYDHAQQRMFFAKGVFCCELSGPLSARLVFDVRESYDRSTEGRVHAIHTKHDVLHRARVSCRGEEFVVLCTQPLLRRDSWLEYGTPYDASRGSSSSWWAYHGLSADVRSKARLVLAPASQEDHARRVLLDDPCWEPRRHWHDRFFLDVAANALDAVKASLPDGSPALLAGLPWFFQVWSRDEAVSVGGLLALRRFRLAAQILYRQIRSLLPDGRLPNRFPASGLGSADGIGWCALRLHQLFFRSRESLDREQWSHVLELIDRALESLNAGLKNGLIINAPKETWMDTEGSSDDTRSGARIEIQCLTMRMHLLHRELSDWLGEEDRFAARREGLHERILNVFYDEKQSLLFDGFADDTVRPNVFLAWYAYPELLDADQWTRIARKALDRLEVDWGGLATIDRDHPLFHENHSGEDDESYHRGDVWYWVNNLAGVMLASLGGEFLDVARRIRAASRKDLLELGAMGYSSEISSACKQVPFGCWAQAWSAATLLELEEKLS